MKQIRKGQYLLKIPIFLTHTVQMKPDSSDPPPELNGFLTHTVQMKLLRSLLFLSHLATFLTHTVQMKPSHGRYKNTWEKDS